MAIGTIIRIFEFCKRLIDLSGGRNQFLQEIKLKTAAIEKIRPTGSGIFHSGDLKVIDKLDVAELLVIINNTKLYNIVEQKLRK